MWDIQTVVHQFSLLSLVPNYHTICLEHCNCLVFLFIFIFCAGIVTDALKSLDCSKRIYFSVFERVSCFFYLTNYPQAVHFYHGYLFKYIEYCFEVRTNECRLKVHSNYHWTYRDGVRKFAEIPQYWPLVHCDTQRPK